MPGDDFKALLPEREVLRTIADKIPAMLAYWDSSLHCRFANRAYVRWFGVSPEWLVGKHISELLGPLYPLNLPYIQAVLRGEPQEFEREIPDPLGGPSRHSLAHYIPDIVEGVVRGFVALVTDISAIKKVDLALRESEARFSLTINEAPIGMALVAPDGRFLRVNRVFCEIVGYTADELTGLTFQVITHPEDLDTDLVLVGQLARGEISRYQLGKRYIRKDGTIVYVMLSASVLRDPDGAPLYYIAQVEDVTERRRLENEQRFLADVGLLLATTLDYDETLARITELAVQDFADLCIMDVIADDETALQLKVSCREPSKAWLCELISRMQLDRRRPHLLRSVLETRRPVFLQNPPEETLAALAQGEEHHRALRAAEIRSMVAVPLIAHTQLLGAIAFISSTPSRVYGPTDVRLAEELAQRAALSIENARLYRSARRATQARDDVLGIVAHDLRNPLNNILMQTTLLRRQGADSANQKPAEAIERAAKRMNRLIRDLLDVTRLEAGHLSVEPERVPAQELVRESLEAQKPLATSASVELRLEVTPDLPEVWADRDRLLQVFENLLGNALKFTKAGGHITIGAEPREGCVLFWVTDTGSGISSEDLPHLFERFWQSRKAQRMGAGLGLPIVKGIIEAHRGHIWVKSTPGQGSTFLFTIPLAHPAEDWRSESAQQGS